MAARLYAVPASHPCATVARALELKGVPYERIDIVPPAHKVVQKLRFGGATVPGIVFDDGRRVLGSRAILRDLESSHPQPPLLPADPDARRAVEEAELWGDEVLQPLVRRIVWLALSRDTAAQLSYMEGARLVPPTPKALAKASGGVVAFLERRINGADEPAVRSDLVALPGHLDRIDGWIERGVLGREEPSAADLQIGSGLRLLQTLDDVAPIVDGRPAGALARRVFPRYAGRIPAGALDAAWLPAAR